MSLSTELIDTSKLSIRQKRKLLRLLEQKAELKKYGGHLHKIFPEEGPLAYYNYPRHMEFFKAGAIHKERLFLAANRVGKTISGAYEVTCHLTGEYPSWWEGRVFKHPTDWWVVGTTGETTRDAPQKALLGTEHGTGMLAKNVIIKVTAAPGTPGGVSQVLVKHVITGGTSTLGFKSYKRQRPSFEGTAKHGIWNDEEPPEDIYNEELLRTMTTDGIMISTLTPLQGYTEFITRFLDTAQSYTEN